MFETANTTPSVEEQPVTEQIIITEKAAQHIADIKKKENLSPEFALRVGVKGGGCSGFSYVLGFDDEKRPNDKVIQASGVTIYIDEKSLYFLAGTELDFSDGLNGKGFVFNNPNAAKTCGCGNSFAV